MNLTDVCIRRPVLAWMIMAATVTFGLVAASRIGISQFPDVDFPTISVSVTWEGAAPEVVENDVLEPLEEALVQVEGLKSITSSARQGSATVTLELNLNRPVDLALQDVQTRVAQVARRLPNNIDPPVVSKSNPEDNPILWVGLSGPFPPQVLSDYARYRVKEKLQTVPGVGEITMGGFLERNIRLWMDARALDERNVTVQDVVAALQREHVELPAGFMQTEGREVSVRVLGEAVDLAALRRLVVREDAGAPTYLEDVALVEDGFEDARRMARVNGNPAQGVGIRKQRGSNAVAVAQGIKAAMLDIRKGLPEGMELGINFDNTVFIEESVHEIEFELLLAILLTALVCWTFLGSFSSTTNVLLAIPMSLLGTVAIIYFLGFTLNTFTLLALSLAVGIVVDDAIMVLENIHRHAEMGKDRVRAATEGTHEITFAALAATLAVIAIFLPVVFMEGVMGKFFLQFGITLSLAVLLSYLEAVTLAPARCAQILNVDHGKRTWVGRGVDRTFLLLERGYARVLRGALRVPLVFVVAGIAMFAGGVKLLQMLPNEFVPSQDQSRLMIRLNMAVGSEIRETDALTRKAEAVLAEAVEVERFFGVVGGFGGSVNQTVLFTTLVPPSARKKTQADVQNELRAKLNAIPGIRAVVQDLSQSGFTASRGFPIEFSVLGPDFEELVRLREDMMRKLTASGLMVDLDTDYQVGMPELRVIPDRARAADLGVSMEAVGTTLNALVGGLRVGKYSNGGRRIDVRARLLSSQRSRPEDLARLRVRSTTGALIPLSSLVTTDERPALQAITRKDRERAISFFANPSAGHSQSEALAFVESLRKDVPVGYSIKLSGASVTFKESSGGLLFALMMGILVAYMVLASQFNSFLHPVTVLTIMPLAVAGAAGALMLGGKTLNIFSMIGLLLLMGIVKKNSIILVDYANQLREAGEDARSAMLKAGPVRLRPIVMTTAATLMAAIPSALALGPGAEVRSPMALAVLGGLSLSTLLSLVVVPAVYVVADDARNRLARLFRGRSEPAAEAPAAHT